MKGEGFHPTQPPLLRGVRHVGSSCASPRAAWWIVPRLFRMYGTQKRQRSKNTSYLDSLKLLYFKLLPFFLGVTIPYTHSFSELVLTFWCLSLCGRSHTLSPGCGNPERCRRLCEEAWNVRSVFGIGYSVCFIGWNTKLRGSFHSMTLQRSLEFAYQSICAGSICKDARLPDP